MKRYERYKPSKVEWIGEIPEHWQTIKIKYSTYVKGRVGWNGLTSSEFLIDGYSYLVTGTDFKDGLVDWEKCYYIDQERYEVDPFIQLKENDLLITKDGTIGKTALVKNLDKPACLNSGIFVTRPLNGVYITPFMYWILNSFEFKKFFDFTSRGSTILHLYQNVFEDFIFAYPDIDEQKVIANYLDKKTAEIEELIADKESLISLLEQEKELTISNILNNKYTEFKFDKEKRKLKYCVNIINGYAFSSEAYTDEGISIIRIGDLKENLDLEQCKKINNADLNKLSQFIIEQNDILIALTGATIGKSIKYSFSELALLNQRVAIIRSKDVLEQDFLKYIIQSKLFKEFIRLECDGGAQENIGKEQLGNFDIVFPKDKVLQQQIVEYLDKKIAETNETVQIIKDEIELLKEYKETLIYEVITGKIDVREWNETH